jgi:hypothetical protein
MTIPRRDTPVFLENRIKNQIFASPWPLQASGCLCGSGVMAGCRVATPTWRGQGRRWFGGALTGMGE